MKFEKQDRHGPTEPQLATMIDVFSILIIFLIAGTAMDSSILNIPIDLNLPNTISKDSTLNSPQITLLDNSLNINFLNEKISLQEIEAGNSSSKYLRIKDKLNKYINNLSNNKTNSLNDQMLKSINLVADRETPYSKLFLVMNFIKESGFQNTILVAEVNSGKKQ